MAEALAAMVYGQALYEAAKEKGLTERIREEIFQVAQIVKEEPDFNVFLTSPSIGNEEKKQMVENVFGSEFCRETQNFLYILIDKGRTGQIRRIARRYAKLHDDEKGIAMGKIYSAVSLREEQLQRFAAEMSKLLQKKVRLVNITDPELIGGVKIHADGRIIDHSLAAELKILLEEMRSGTKSKG